MTRACAEAPGRPTIAEQGAELDAGGASPLTEMRSERGSSRDEEEEEDDNTGQQTVPSRGRHARATRASRSASWGTSSPFLRGALAGRLLRALS